ncbi:unnamed protein product [Xylocopa violacea]|uniref:RING-type E3 ubiquitin transferase BRCA1 n=1 Tax=Xylocopa violacea TaxID=135666 RepID=A0ABP1NEC5_XYLVO
MQRCLMCTICLHTISDPIKNSCGHQYCRTCIQSVLQNIPVRCPLCNVWLRNISSDKHVVVFVDRLQKLMDAFQLDSGINQSYVSGLPLRLDPPLTQEPLDCGDSTMSVSQNCADNGMENSDEDIKIVSEVMMRDNTRCSVSKQLSGGPSRDKHNENQSNDRWDCRKSFETRSAQNFTSKMNFDIDNPQPSTSGATGSNDGEKESSQVRLKKNWSTVARFGKEMRAKGKKLKSLNVSIENKRKSGSLNESTTNLDKEEVVMSKKLTKDRGKYIREEICKGVREVTQNSKTKEFSERKKNLPGTEDGSKERKEGTKEVFWGSNREDNSIAEEIQPVCESSFITPDYGKITIPEKRHVDPTNTPFENRIKKIPSQMTSAGSAEIRNQVNLVNKLNDEADNSSPSLIQEIELIDELYSVPRFQASIPIGNRLSPKKQVVDPRSNNSSDSNADSRLQAVRRDLNRQIDESSGHADADNNSGRRIIEAEKNRSSGDNEKHDNERVRGSITISSSRRGHDVGQTSSPVMFQRLGKVYKYRKKRVRFFYLGRTRQEESLGSSYCDLRLQKPYSLVDVLDTQDLEYACAPESVFGNNALITVNETPIIEHDEAETVSIVKDAPKQCNTVYGNPNKTQSIDVDLLTLDENEGTVQPCVEHSTTLLKNTSPTKNSQQQFPERSKCSSPKASYKILARTSQNACNTDPLFTPTERKESRITTEFEDKSEEEEYASDHSFSSQVTCITMPTKKISARNIGTACLSIVDRDNVDGSTNDRLDVSPKSKRKRSVSFDSSEEEDLCEIANNWCETGESGTRCKKKGKSEEERDSTYSADASGKARTSISFISCSRGNKFAGNCDTEKLKDNLEDNLDDIMANVDTAELASITYNPDNTSKPIIGKMEFLDDNWEKKYIEESSLALYSNSSDKQNKRSVSRALYNDSDSNADIIFKPEHTVTRKSLKKDKFLETSNLVDSTSKETMIPSNCATRLLMNWMSNIDSDVATESTMKNMHEQDSLMNITEDSLMMKQFEQDLFGKTIRYEKEQRTPQKLKEDKRSNDEEVEHSGEEDDIVENTPDTKTKRQATNLSRGSSTVSPFSKITGESLSNVSSPLCRRKTYPLCQSTPKAHRSSIKSNCGLTKFTFSNEQTDIEKSVLRVPQSVQVIDNQRLCFVCTGLVSFQIEQVNRLAHMVNARYVTQFELDVTHVIVRTNKNNNGTDKTLKYLQGIVHKKWIVSYKWVVDSLSEGRLVNELPYEAVDSKTLEAGPRKSRLSEEGLFTGFAFLCIGPYPDISVEQYQDLLRAMGATVVNNLDSLAAERTKLKIIVIQSDVYEYKIIEWYKKTRAVPIFYDWVVECISRYKLTSFYLYLQELSQQDVRNLGFPEYLVEEVHDEDSDIMYDVSM